MLGLKKTQAGQDVVISKRKKAKKEVKEEFEEWNGISDSSWIVDPMGGVLQWGVGIKGSLLSDTHVLCCAPSFAKARDDDGGDSWDIKTCYSWVCVVQM